MSVNGISNVGSLSNVKTAVDIPVAKLAKDAVKQSGKDLVDMMKQSSAKMEQSVRPHVGGNIDICC